jgi:hypothetical protein
MDKWAFEADTELNELCDSIVAEMIRLFDISEDEAVLRINRQWKGQRFKGHWDMVYHEDALTWAKNIYYGHEYYWWIEGNERERRHLAPLKPKPL